jgi:hypothetical protein
MSHRTVLIQNINETLSSLEKAISSSSSINSINSLCEDAEQALKAYKNYEPINTQEKIEQARLTSEFSKRFDNLVQKATDVKITSENVLDFEQLNDDIIRQRDEHVKKIEGKMKIVGEIMRDTAEMTKEQGEKLDRIDLEIGFAKENTGKGVNQLEKTSRRQRIKKGICVTVLITVAIALTVVIIIVFAVKR